MLKQKLVEESESSQSLNMQPLEKAQSIGAKTLQPTIVPKIPKTLSGKQ